MYPLCITWVFSCIIQGRDGKSMHVYPDQSTASTALLVVGYIITLLLLGLDYIDSFTSGKTTRCSPAFVNPGV